MPGLVVVIIVEGIVEGGSVVMVVLTSAILFVIAVLILSRSVGLLMPVPTTVKLTILVADCKSETIFEATVLSILGLSFRLTAVTEVLFLMSVFRMIRKSEFERLCPLKFREVTTLARITARTLSTYPGAAISFP